MDLSGIKKVIQVADAERAQQYLDTGLWVILSIANGQDSDLSPCQLFALGSHDPNAEAELPVLPRDGRFI